MAWPAAPWPGARFATLIALGHAAPFQRLRRAGTRAAARRCAARQRKGPSQPPVQGFVNTAARARPSCHGRALSGPGRQVRGLIGGAEQRSQTGLHIATSDASSAACVSTEHSWPPQADTGPQGCEGEFCASPGLVSGEGSLNAVKASAAGAECLPAWAAARTHPLTTFVEASPHIGEEPFSTAVNLYSACYAGRMTVRTSGETGMTWRRRLGTLLVSALFAIGFGTGGYFGGLRPLSQVLHAAWDVRDWQPVSAKLLHVDLHTKTGRRGGHTYAVQTRYRYEFNGQLHEGDRVGLDGSGSSDNVGGWHQRWASRLRAAMDADQAVTAWVDPHAPDRALLDPCIRWDMLALQTPFALVFSLVGLVAACIFCTALLPSSVSTTARSRVSVDAQGSIVLWLFAIAWSGMAFPFAAVAWMKPTPAAMRVLLGLFAVIGLALLALAVRQTWRAWVYAGSELRIRPAEPRAGQHFDVDLRLAHRTAWRWGQHATTLRLAQYLIDDSAKDSTDKQMLAFDGLAQPLPQSDDRLRLRASFQLPEDAPAQGAQCGGLRVDWRLELLSPEGRLAYSCPVAVRAAATPPATPPPAVSPTAPSAPPAPGHSPAAGRARPGRAAPSPAR